MALTESEKAIAQQFEEEGKRYAALLAKAHGYTDKWLNKPLRSQKTFEVIGVVFATVAEKCKELDDRLKALEAESSPKPRHRVAAGRRPV